MSYQGWSSANFLRLASGVVTAVPLTMACWAKTSIVGSATAQALMGLYTSSAGANLHCFELAIRQSTNLVLARVGDASVSTAASAQSGAITANTWFHACGTFASSTLRNSYLNGSSPGTNTTARTPVGINRTSIGINDSSAAALPFADTGVGEIVEAGIWNIVLSDGEIDRLAQGVPPYFVQREHLVAYWPIAFSAPLINPANPNNPMTVQGTLTNTNPQISFIKRPKLILNRSLI